MTIKREGSQGDDVRTSEAMMTSSLRTRIGIVLAVLVLAGIGWIVWPFMAGPNKMQNFCGSLTAGASVAQVQTQAAQQGFRVSSLIEGRAFIHEPSSFGRFTCNVQFGSNGLVSSAYVFND